MKINKNLVSIIFLTVISMVAWWEVYVPKTFKSGNKIVYVVQKGMGDEEIAQDLESLKIVKNGAWFRIYAVISRRDSKLQAGKYELSPSMSVAGITRKLVRGDVVKEKITVIEGWSIKDIIKYFENKNIYSIEKFLSATNKDWSIQYELLQDKPKSLNLEGYLFPDTYEILPKENPEHLIMRILDNFDKKLTPDLRQTVAKNEKAIFQIVTMASILEREVRSFEDKEKVSGILWKRIKAGVPLQVDSTVNYVTGKKDARVAIIDTQVDSRYNTYKYYGLPLGPISNPGMESILAAVYPKETDYWYYLSADHNGETIFSKTLEEHNEAKAKYLN